MKKIISLLLTVVMLFGMTSVLSACGAPKDPGAEVNVYLGSSVFDFDPSDYYVSAEAEQILSLLYEPLFTLNERGKLKFAAAKDYDVDEDERKITIELRDSYWSDGIQLKASDYIYAWCERIINASVPNPAAALFYDIEGVKEVAKGEGTTSDIAIKATEMKRIVITYCEGADYKRILKNLASVATAPVRQDIVETAESYWSKSANTIITNGPFKMKSYKLETGEFELARNVGYHQDPTVKDYDNKVNPALIYTVFGDTAVSYKDIEEKVVFVMADAPLSDRSAYTKKADVADHTSTYTYVFNTKHPLLSDVNARLALSAAIDREAIVNAITFAKAADGFVPDVSSGSEETLISAKADTAKANQYWSKVDPALLTAENKSITLTVNNDPVSLKIAELVEAAWEGLGLTVTVEALDKVDNTLTVSSGEDGQVTVTDSAIQTLIKDASYGKVDYDVIAVDWQTYCTDAAVALASLTSHLNGMGVEFDVDENGTDVKRANVTGWSDAKYDGLVDAIYSAEGKKERAEACAEAEKYLMGAMPVCPIVFNQNFVFESSKVSGVDFDGLGNIVFTDLKLSGYKNYLKPEEE